MMNNIMNINAKSYIIKIIKMINPLMMIVIMI